MARCENSFYIIEAIESRHSWSTHPRQAWRRRWRPVDRPSGARWSLCRPSSVGRPEVERARQARGSSVVRDVLPPAPGALVEGMTADAELLRGRLRFDELCRLPCNSAIVSLCQSGRRLAARTPEFVLAMLVLRCSTWMSVSPNSPRGFRQPLAPAATWSPVASRAPCSRPRPLGSRGLTSKSNHQLCQAQIRAVTLHHSLASGTPVAVGWQGRGGCGNALAVSPLARSRGPRPRWRPRPRRPGRPGGPRTGISSARVGLALGPRCAYIGLRILRPPGLLCLSCGRRLCSEAQVCRGRRGGSARPACARARCTRHALRASRDQLVAVHKGLSVVRRGSRKASVRVHVSKHRRARASRGS